VPDLASLTVDDFAPLEGAPFRLRWDGTDVPLVLEEVRELGRREGFRNPFSLLFRGPAAPLLPQQVHELAGDGLGELALFLVPVGADERGAAYEAVFT
jgi:hypothetical protein